MPERKEETNQSQPPNDPMGIGGEKRRPGYGKYPGTGEGADQSTGGVPGASGDPHSTPPGAMDNEDKGDQVNREMNIVHPSEDVPKD